MKDKSTLSHKLINALRENIKSMKIGDRLPSERQLCEDYGVSRTTVRNAIADLELNGYIKRIQGKGTFVQNPAILRHNLSDYYSFTEQTKKMGKVPRTDILEYHIERVNSLVAERMSLEDEDLIIRIVRLRSSNDVPLLFETTFIEYDDFPEITKPLLEELPLYEIFEKKYGRKIYRVNEIFSVSSLNKYQADTLKVRNGDPCLKINRLSYDKEDKIIEFTVSLARGDKFNYQTTYFPK